MRAETQQSSLTPKFYLNPTQICVSGCVSGATIQLHVMQPLQKTDKMREGCLYSFAKV